MTFTNSENAIPLAASQSATVMAAMAPKNSVHSTVSRRVYRATWGGRTSCSSRAKRVMSGSRPRRSVSPKNTHRNTLITTGDAWITRSGRAGTSHNTRATAAADTIAAGTGEITSHSTPQARIASPTLPQRVSCRVSATCASTVYAANAATAGNRMTGPPCSLAGTGTSELCELLLDGLVEVVDPAVVVAVDAAPVIVEIFAVPVRDAVAGRRVRDVDLCHVRAQVEPSDDVPGPGGLHLPAETLAGALDGLPHLLKRGSLRRADGRVVDVVDGTLPARDYRRNESESQDDQRLAEARHRFLRSRYAGALGGSAATEPLATVRETVKPTSRL